ncbi:MAG: hypothetical protein HZA54_19260 [Planctomycetes bacterium]|nr:hypothetical protein [Planctomycetota bacterium]
MIFFGTNTYGEVDKVPGLFHVTTKFFYLQFVPLIPMQSFLMFEEEEAADGPRGIKIPMSGKSVGVAYARTLGVLALLVCAPASLFQLYTFFSNADPVSILVPLGWLGGAILAASLLVLTYALARPTEERVIKLVRAAGIADQEAALLARFRSASSGPAAPTGGRPLGGMQGQKPGSTNPIH